MSRVTRGPRDEDLGGELWVDWESRLPAELAFLESILADAPSERVLDLGCGTGRHALELAVRGYDVTGIDASEAAILRAQERPGAEAAQFLLGDLGAVERLVRGHFGAALCLGNTLPHLLSAESVSRLLVGLKRRLLPGAALAVQQINYEPVFEGGRRALPVERFRNRDEEFVVTRLLDPRSDGIVLHTTVAARHDPRGQPPVEIVDIDRAQLRGWRIEEIEVMLDVARFGSLRTVGGVGGEAFEAERSTELVVVARA